MLSLGTELPLALAIASASVGLPAGSPPPVRAATSMFLMSLAKSLPRLASIAAFLCFVVAHLEWPLTSVPPRSRHRRRPARPGGLMSCRSDDVHEQRMHPALPGQLGVEARGHQIALADGHDPTVGRSAQDPPEDLHRLAGLLDPRRADEHRMHRAALDAGQGQVRLEAV